jgi:hypothetical protein
MTKLTFVAFLSLGSLIAAAPALAKTSTSRAHQICETAAQVLRPAPKSARADKAETQTTSDTIVVRLNVRTADGGLADVLCTVDRATSMATLKPSNLWPPGASPAPAP